MIGSNAHRCLWWGLCVIILVLTLPRIAQCQVEGASGWMFAGHSKYQFIHTSIPDNSVLQDINGDSLTDHHLEVRLKASARRGRWGFNTHLQFIGVYSDTLDGLRDQPPIIFPGANVINDDRRWFDLTYEITNEGKNATILRLDRISVSYTGEKSVVRFGRQAISWGNGLLFTPMDIFNPFDPTAVDKEYKTGDDMLYGQYLLDNGNDVQAVAVVRRNPLNGEVEQDVSSLAVKYHGFVDGHEYDLLLAEHYGERVMALGASTDHAGAVWRGDLVWTDTNSGSIFSSVVGVSYSWIAGGRNWSGFLEYYYNGFGQSGGNYSAADLAGNPELVQRISRGELFNLARHYLGASVTVELTPLLHLTPNAFINLTDPSALVQVVLSYDWQQDIQVLAALSVPVGPDGSEYGGIEARQPELFVSSGPSLFAQLAWYF
ncbi:MAG: hypothetical protein GQ538_09420 [Xanthomonadales bacterium]|nr:hypothetical protein [Xanthomonadales bacterium]